MTTVERTSSAISSIDVAGVDWPVYKVAALGLGAAVFLIMLLLAATMATAVLSAAGAASLVWVLGGLVH